jgi:hypothetical protein
MIEFITLGDMDRLVSEANGLPVDLTPETYKKTTTRGGKVVGNSIWNDFFDLLLTKSLDELGIRSCKNGVEYDPARMGWNTNTSGWVSMRRSCLPR